MFVSGIYNTIPLYSWTLLWVPSLIQKYVQEHFVSGTVVDTGSTAVKKNQIKTIAFMELNILVVIKAK